MKRWKVAAWIPALEFVCLTFAGGRMDGRADRRGEAESHLYDADANHQRPLASRNMYLNASVCDIVSL